MAANRGGGGGFSVTTRRPSFDYLLRLTQLGGGKLHILVAAVFIQTVHNGLHTGAARGFSRSGLSRGLNIPKIFRSGTGFVRARIDWWWSMGIIIHTRAPDCFD